MNSNYIFNILIDFVSLLTIFLTCLRALLSMFPFTFSGLYGGYMVISFKTYIFSPCHVTSSILKLNVHSVTNKNRARLGNLSDSYLLYLPNLYLRFAYGLKKFLSLWRNSCFEGHYLFLFLFNLFTQTIFQL